MIQDTRSIALLHYRSSKRNVNITQLGFCGGMSADTTRLNCSRIRIYQSLNIWRTLLIPNVVNGLPNHGYTGLRPQKIPPQSVIAGNSDLMLTLGYHPP